MRSERPPKFSILLPTKNRSEILGGAVESALAQTFPDFELILSDNDDSPEATAVVARSYADPRIRYDRTSGRLAMHENWDHAFALARGENVLILEDKVRLVSNALEILNRRLEEFGPSVLSYKLKFARGSSIVSPPLDPPGRIIRSQEAAEKFCRFEHDFFQILPKGLDSCAPRRLLEKIRRQSPTGFLFSYISPDYASGFMVLSEVDAFYHIDACLEYIPNNWMWQGRYSNGQSNYKKDAQILRFMRELPVPAEEILRHVPVKSQFLWINSVIYDFLTKYKRRDHQPQIDWASYYAFCLILILMGKKVGGDMRPEYREIRTALGSETWRTRWQVAAKFIRRAGQLGFQAAWAAISHS